MKEETMQLEFTCNGRPVRLEADGSMRALDLLRDLLGLTGTKEGCGRGECGACTILLDGEPVNACLLYAAKLQGRAVRDRGGAGRRRGRPAPPAGGLPGGRGGAVRVLHARHAAERQGAAGPRARTPTVAEIEEALSGNLCRCTGYGKIVQGGPARGGAGRGAGRARRRDRPP